MQPPAGGENLSLPARKRSPQKVRVGGRIVSQVLPPFDSLLITSELLTVLLRLDRVGLVIPLAYVNDRERRHW